MPDDRPALSLRFLASGTFLLACLSIAAFRLTFRPAFAGDTALVDVSGDVAEIIAQVCAMMLLTILERLCSCTLRQLSVVLVCGALLQAAGSFLVVFSPLAGTPLEGVPFAVRGVGSASFFLMLGWVLGSMAPARSALCIAGGQLLTEMIALAQGALPDTAAIASLCFYPVVGMVCLLLVLRRQPLSADDGRPPQLGLRSGTVVESACLLAICATSKTVLALFEPPFLADGDRLYSLSITVMCLIVFLAYVVWLYVLKRRDPDRLWPFLMLIVFGGLFACSSLFLMVPDFAFSLLKATQRMIMLFSWVFLASVIYQRGLPAVPVFCLGQLAFSQAPYLVANFIKINGLQVDSANQDATIVVATVVLALAVLVGVLAVVSKGSADQAPVERRLSAEEALRQSVDALARTYGLSEREAEVALLVAKGYTLSACGEVLHISLNTVRVHSRNLYKKLDIHKKSDLLRLIEGRDA
ncbi:MAG TPA: helix-turn-helix transcriptional regulator [Candidatus Rubneribacter avistercoris]|nr:helix-turn-helix transcriptional regulator [Candidatus Rubneribacter avistercoris]